MTYVDTNILIYLFEANRRYGLVVASKMDELREQGTGFITSVLSVAEVFAKHEIINDQVFHETNDLALIDVNEVIALRAAHLQRQHGLKIGDAVHLATCLETGCDTIFTNDDRLARVAADYCKVLKPAAAC